MMRKVSLPLATLEVKLSSVPAVTALSAVGKFAGVDKASEFLGFLLNRKQIYELFFYVWVLQLNLFISVSQMFFGSQERFSSLSKKNNDHFGNISQSPFRVKILCCAEIN